MTRLFNPSEPSPPEPLWQHAAVYAGLALIVAAGVWRMWALTS